MGKIIIYMLLSIQFTAYAQEFNTTSKHFIYKYNGEIINAKSIDYKAPLFKKSYLQYDGHEMDTKEVQFYQVEHGFFINLKNIRKGFAERIIKGKINLYEQTTTTTTWTNNGFGPGMPMTTTNTTRYYNFGFGEVKTANYDNLMTDMQDNAKSIEHLSKYQKTKNRRTIWYVIGGAAMLGGMLTAIEKTGESYFDTQQFETVEETKIKPVNLTIGLAGFATIIATAINSRKKPDYIKEAVLIYNENE